AGGGHAATQERKEVHAGEHAQQREQDEPANPDRDHAVAARRASHVLDVAAIAGAPAHKSSSAWRGIAEAMPNKPPTSNLQLDTYQRLFHVAVCVQAGRIPVQL